MNPPPTPDARAQYDHTRLMLMLLGIPLVLASTSLSGALILLAYAFIEGQIKELALIIAVFGTVGNIITSVVSLLAPSPLGTQRRQADTSPTAPEIGAAVGAGVVAASNEQPIQTESADDATKDGAAG